MNETIIEGYCFFCGMVTTSILYKNFICPDCKWKLKKLLKIKENDNS